MITLLKVRNYKSLENIELALGPLHVLVGPNNSGKSNLFDVFQFLRELAEIGGQAVHSRGGFSQIVWGGDVKRAISFEIHALIESGKSKKEKLIYQLEIGGSTQHHSITKERLSVFNRQEKEKPLLIFPVENFKAALIDVNGRKWEPGRAQDRLFLEQIQDEERYGTLAIFARELIDRRWRDRGEIFNPKKIATFVKLVSQGRAAKIIICVDSECTAPEITERNLEPCKKAIRELKIKTTVDFQVIVHALETWLAADEEALHSALNAKRAIKTRGNLEMECRPENILKDVYRKHGREFIKSKDDLAIAAKVNPTQIAKRCSSFRRFQRILLSQ